MNLYFFKTRNITAFEYEIRAENEEKAWEFLTNFLHERDTETVKKHYEISRTILTSDKIEGIICEVHTDIL